jgi:hypothetical protein
MIPHTDPERPALSDVQKLRMDQCWRKGLIGDSTYVRSLTFCGYLPKDACTELNLLKLERSPTDYETRRISASKAWMEGRR